MNQCLECLQLTSNPKFCSSSCAARFNNKKRPKRRPEGQCSKCGASIPKRSSICESCKLKESELANKKNQNIREITTRIGVVEKKLPKIHVSKKLIFKYFEYGVTKEIDYKKDKCGDFLDQVIEITFNRPQYVPEKMVQRTITLINDFLNFEFPIPSFACDKGSGSKGIKVADWPMSLIGRACEVWIYSFFKDKHYPLLPIFALSTAEYIRAHLKGYSGYYGENEDWELKGPLLPSRQGYYGSMEFLEDREFKKRFTQRMGSILINFKIPPGVMVKGQEYFGNEVFLLPDVLMECRRCYLSEDFYDYYNEIFIQDNRQNEINIFSGFRIPGGVFYGPPKDNYHYKLLRGSLPGEWIVGVTQPDICSEFVKIPEWIK